MGVSLLQHPPTLPTGQHTNIFELQAHPPYVWWPNNPLKSLNDSASSKSVCFSLSLFFFFTTIRVRYLLVLWAVTIFIHLKHTNLFCQTMQPPVMYMYRPVYVGP